ncbi:sporulation integral membrane protein YtvI [Ohessyouella blattaphilus]|uniref:sporulation integral membrane protein YtvI n=1 Tax=Ohessyouella blattaphilus TaxID=2949333 RepID=UPI003EB9269D
MRRLSTNRSLGKILISLFFGVLATVLFVLAGVGVFKYFMPFIIGWFISYIAGPVIRFLEKRVKIVKKIGSALIIIIVLGGVVVGLYFIGLFLYRELSGLVKDLPEIYRSASEAVDNLVASLNQIVDGLPGGVQESLRTFVNNFGTYINDFIKDLGTPTFQMAGNVAKRIPSIFISIIITVIAAYFFIAERDEILVWLKKVAPQAIVNKMTLIMANLKFAVGGYFKAQFKIMGVVFILLNIGFVILSVPYYVLLALLVAFLDFLPFFGTGTALIPWAVYELVTKDYKMAIGLLIIYGVTQLVRQLIQPKLVGDSMGLNPLVTLIFLYIGYRVGGVLGMIFSVPIGMIIINLYKAGGFDYLLQDIKDLAAAISELRK